MAGPSIRSSEGSDKEWLTEAEQLKLDLLSARIWQPQSVSEVLSQEGGKNQLS